MTVGKRLKEERKRFGLTQEEMAVQLGVTRYAQLNFEKDINLPGGAYLLAALGRGVDVMYVLTGQAAQLEPSDAQLLAAFHAAQPSARAAALAAVGLGPESLESAGAKVTVKGGKVGQINTVAGDLQQTNSFDFSSGKKKR